MAKKKTKQTNAPKKVAKEAPVEAPKKKKKKHTGLKVFAILMTIFVVFPIAFVFIAFFDTSTKKVSNSEITYQNIVSRSLATSFDYLHDVDLDDNPDPKIGLYIDEQMIDGIMMSACDMINQKKFIPKMYCSIKGNNYTFYLDAQAAFFKTRVNIRTKLEKVVDEDFNSTLIFKITGFGIGRLPIPLNWITGIAGNFIKESTINDAFAKAGFNIKCNFNKLQLTYEREQFRTDVGAYLSKLGGDNPYLNILLDVLDNEKILQTNYEDGVTVAFKLAPLMIEEWDDYYKEAPVEFTDLEAHRAKVEDLLNNHNLPEADVAKVFTFLIRGFENSNSDIQNYITNIAETEIGSELTQYLHLAALTNYTGSNLENGNSFTDYCEDNIPWTEIIKYSTSESNKVSFCLPSNELNPVLAKKLNNVIGTTIPITFKDGNNWNFEYITVDNVYTGFKPDETEANKYQFIIYLRLNIDGLPITLAITSNNIDVAENTTEQLGYLSFDLKDIYFGDIKIDDDAVINIILNLFQAEEEQESVFIYHHDSETNLDQLWVSLDNLIPEEAEVEGYLNEIHTIKEGCENPVQKVVEASDTFELTYTINP